MPKFFLPQDCFAGGGRIEADGADARHIAAALRMKPGDLLTVCDMRRHEYDCVIEEITDGRVIMRIRSEKTADGDPDISVALYQAFVKGDKMDYIIQKAAELGVSSITPVMTDRAISRPDSGGMEKKLSRWRKIAAEASGQCGRSAPVTVHPAADFSRAAEEIRASSAGFICCEGEHTVPVRRYLSGRTIKEAAFLIGPEGGLSEREVYLAQETGIPLVGLGKRILRTETASGCVLSVLMYETDNL